MKIRDIFKRRKVNGLLGVEIEIEGHGFPEAAIEGWSTTMDGSLRAGGVEYVFSNPCSLAEAKKRITLLKKTLKGANTVINDSIRAGVHVHVNVQDKTPVEVFTLATCYYVFENILCAYCGENREGNLFCLRAVDADYVIEGLVQAVESEDITILNSDNIRYAALNFNALARHGSLEFRQMRTPSNLSDIKEWLDILVQMFKYCEKNFNTPHDVVGLMSEYGCTPFIERVFGDYADTLRAACPDWDTYMWEGVRIAQDVAFSHNNWDNFSRVKNPSPFAIEEALVDVNINPDRPRRRI